MKKPQDTKFVIGIGAQRCGSTLLYQALDAIRDVFMHPIKELHYFDCRTMPADSGFRQRQRKIASKRLNSMKFWEGRLGEDRVLRRSNELISLKEQREYDYFELFDRVTGSYKYLGEVTPRYALLKPDEIRYMRDVVGDAKIIFSKRDPLKRVISAFKLRMYGYSGLATKGHNSDDDIDEMFLQTLANDTAWVTAQRRFNDYPRTIANYREHFSDVLVLDYEHFSTSTDFRTTLESFLGLDIDPELFQRRMATRYNSFDRNYKPSDAVIERIVNVFALEPALQN